MTYLEKTQLLELGVLCIQLSSDLLASQIVRLPILLLVHLVRVVEADQLPQQTLGLGALQVQLVPLVVRKMHWREGLQERHHKVSAGLHGEGFKLLGKLLHLHIPSVLQVAVLLPVWSLVSLGVWKSSRF